MNVRVQLQVTEGRVTIWCALTDGFYDPARFPETPILSGESGVEVTAAMAGTREQALVVRPEVSGPRVRYVLGVFVEDVEALWLEALPYVRAGKVAFAEKVRHQLSAVKPMPRIGGYRVALGKIARGNPVFEATPALPREAQWLS